MARQFGEHGGEFAMAGAAAAEFGRDAGDKEAGLLHLLEIGGDEFILGIRVRRAFGEAAPEVAGQRGPVVRGGLKLGYRRHGVLHGVIRRWQLRRLRIACCASPPLRDSSNNRLPSGGPADG